MTLSLASCGTRTGLIAPCIIAVDPTPPAVVVISNREAGSDDELPPGFIPQLAQVALWQRVLPMLDGVALMGGVVRPDANNGGWPCDHVAALTVSIAPNHSAAVIADLQARAADRRFAAVGIIDVRPTLVNAAMELRRVAAPDAARFILLTHTGFACEQPDYDVGPELAADDLRTMVISLERIEPSGGALWLLNGLADAGGLARPDGPIRFYDVREHDVLAQAIADTILASYFCRGRPHTSVRAPERATLRAVGLSPSIIDPDVSHRNGWDWIDDGARVEVFGDECRRIVAGRAALTIIDDEGDCLR